MADHKLKISADTSDVKKSLLDLKKTIQQSVGKSNIQLFSKDTNELLKRGAARELEKLNKEAKKLTDQINAQTKALLKAKQGTKEYAQEYAKLIETTKKMVGVTGQKTELSGMATGGMGATSSGGAFGGGMMGGMLGGLAKSPWAWLAAAGLWTGHEGMKGLDIFKQGANTRIGLRGRGMRRLGLRGGEASQAALYGLDENEFLAQQYQAMDVFGTAGATNKSVLQRARFERGRGVAPGTLTNLGAGISSQIGGREANTAIMKLQASLIASGIKDRIGPYLEVAASMLTRINTQGLSSNVEILSTLAHLVSKTGGAPEIVSSVLMGIDSHIRNATGEQAAFLMGAFAKAGIGGGTVGGAQLSMTGGLFGVNKNLVPKAWQPAFEQSGLFATPQAKMKAMLEYAEAGNIHPFSTDPRERQMALLAAPSLLGITDPTKRALGYDYAKTISEGGPRGKWAASQLDKLKDKTGDENIKDIAGSLEGALKIQEDIRSILLTHLGQPLAGIEIKRLKVMSMLDAGLGQLAPGVADALTLQESKANRRLTGNADVLNPLDTPPAIRMLIDTIEKSFEDLISVYQKGNKETVNSNKHGKSPSAKDLKKVTQ